MRAVHAPMPPCSAYERPPNGQIHLPVFTPSMIGPGGVEMHLRVLLAGLHEADGIAHVSPQNTPGFATYAPILPP
jgi:hypothetical protein